MIGGAFGIPKSATEHRVISDIPVNDILDPAMLPRPRFAYTPRLRTLVTKPGTYVCCCLSP